MKTAQFLCLLTPLMLIAFLLATLAPPTVTTAQSAVTPLCRLGVNIFKEAPANLALDQLRLGWYLDGWADATHTHPSGIEYVLTIQLHGDDAGGYSYQPAGAELDAAIAAHPGASWLIGNEPDRRHYQNNLLPATYAAVYHELYTYLKTRDPAARVLAGSIVQATPLRLEYLDQVLAAYQATYSTPLPVDGWNIHNFILNERSCDYYQDSTICWGADIPPGSDAIDGMVLTVDDHDRLDLFIAQIERFRAWMLANGYRHTPLYLTEYGILMPEWLDPEQFAPTQVNAFMDATFDYLLAATDPATGYPPDGNRLVQRMAWYAATTDQLMNSNGILFVASDPANPATYVLSEMGENYRDYAANLTAATNLSLLSLTGVLTPTSAVPGAVVTVTLAAQVANQGNRQTGATAQVHFYAGDSAHGALLTQTPITLTGCGDATTVAVVVTSTAPADLADLRFTAALTTANPADINPDNGHADTHVRVASDLLYLPTLRRP